MSRKIEVVQGVPIEQIMYAHSAAVVAGNIIYHAKLGALVAHDSYAINVTGVYYKAGRFRADIATAKTIAQGDKLYYDVSLFTVCKSNDATLIEGDFYAGVAVEAGTATAGYVVFDLNADPMSIAKGGYKTFVASATLTLAEEYVKLDGTSAVVTLTLPAAATSLDKEYWFEAINVGNALTIDPNASEVIGPASATTYVFATVGSVLHIKCDGTRWRILHERNLNSYYQREIVAVNVADLGAGDDITTRPIWVAPDTGCTLVSVGILTQGAPAGVDDANTSVITIEDSSGNDIVVKTYNTATQPPSAGYESLGALNATHKVLTAAEVVHIIVTNGATANLPVFFIVFVYQVS